MIALLSLACSALPSFSSNTLSEIDPTRTPLPTFTATVPQAGLPFTATPIPTSNFPTVEAAAPPPEIAPTETPIPAENTQEESPPAEAEGNPEANQSVEGNTEANPPAEGEAATPTPTPAAPPPAAPTEPPPAAPPAEDSGEGLHQPPGHTALAARLPFAKAGIPTGWVKRSLSKLRRPMSRGGKFPLGFWV
jgi:hypothetical protein